MVGFKILSNIIKIPCKFGKKGINQVYKTGKKCLNKYGIFSTSVGITTAPILAKCMLSSGNPILMSIFAIPGSMTFTVLGSAALTKKNYKLANKNHSQRG